jgi:serine/threonine protein kinase
LPLVGTFVVLQKEQILGWYRLQAVIMQGTFKRGISRRDGLSVDESEEQITNHPISCSDNVMSRNVNDTSWSLLERESSTMELTDESRVHHQILDTAASSNQSALSTGHQRQLATQSAPIDHQTDIGDDSVVDSRENPPIGDPIHLAAPNTIWKPRGLTLSAFRRPEHTIRLTQADPSRKIEAEYDLHGTAGRGVLGHGAFSTVRLAVRLSDGQKVAVKSIAKHEALRSRRLRRVSSNADSKRYLEEWEILKRLQNQPHVIDLLDVFETTEEIQLVTEYCPGGELFDAIQKKQRRNHDSAADLEAQAAQIVSQILKALVDIHAAGIVHKDVKPENILLAKPTDGKTVNVKLCDFGVARPLIRQEAAATPKVVDEGASDSVCIGSDGEASPLTPCSRSRSFSTIGSDYYAAPELTYGGSYDTAVDIYSLGVTLYILLCGFPPVFATSCQPVTQDDGDDDDDDSSDEAPFGEVLFPDAYWNNISDGAKSLLKKMLHSDAAARITAKRALQDPWIIQACAPSHSNRHKQSRPTQAPVDLNLVRSQLYKSLEEQEQQQQQQKHRTPPRRWSSLSCTDRASKRRSQHSVLCTTTTPSPGKRVRGCLNSTPRRRDPRTERRASTSALMALADLYRGVAAPTVIAAAAAAAAATSSEANSTTGTSASSKKEQADFTATKGSPVPAWSF